MADDDTLLHGLDPRDLVREGFSALRGSGGAPWSPPGVEELGQELERYEVVRLAGRGGMGAVYEARDRKLGRRVALKVLPPELALDARAADRFLAEERALAALAHPHIVTLYDAGETAGGSPFFVMEYVEGEDLAARLKRGRLPRAEALALIVTVAVAVAAAHGAGVLHRDLKPSNILLGADGRARVADFGLSAMTGAANGEWLDGGTTGSGTEWYAAPEQLEGLAEPTAQADVYSLGVVAYELLTGERPGGDLSGALRAAEVDARYDAPLLRALSPEPERRTGSVREFLDAMRSAEEAAAEEAAARERLRRVRRIAVAMGVLGAAAAALAVVALRQSQEVERSGEFIREQEMRTRRTSAMVDFDLGNEAALRMPPDPLLAEFHLARAVASDPDNTLAATRLASLRRTYPRAEAVGAVMEHPGAIRCAAFNKDGSRVVTTGDDGTARLWSGADGAPVSPPLVHGAPVVSAAFSPDGKWLATADEGGTARLWNAADGAAHGPALVHGKELHTVEFSPDSARVATCGEDNTARVWNTADATAALPPLRHDGGVTSARWSPDGTRLLTTSTDCTVRLWSAADGKLLHQQGPDGLWNLEGRWSPDGALAAVSIDWGESRVLRLPQTGAADSAWPLVFGSAGGHTPRRSHSAEYVPCVFSPDGRLVVTPTQEPEWLCARYLPHGAWSLLQPRHSKRITAAAFSQDGTRFATAGNDGEAKVWDVKTGRLLLTPLKLEGEVKAVAFPPDGRLLTATSRGAAQLWQLPQPAALPHALPSSRNGSEVWETQLSHYGSLLVTAGNDHHVHLWNAHTLQPDAEPWDTGHHVTSCEFSPDDRLLAVTNHSTAALVLDIAARKVLNELPHLGYDPVKARFSADGKRIVTAVEDGACVVWKFSDTAHPLIIRTETAVHDALFTADGRCVVAACGDGFARRYDAATGAAQPYPVRHDRAILSLDLSGDGTLLLTASADQSIRVWNANTGEPQGDFMQHHGRVMRARFSRDAARIAAMCETGEVRVWSTAHSRLLYEPVPGAAEGLSICFTADGRSVVTGSKRGEALVWRLE